MSYTDEYLMVVKPVIDVDAWKTASGNISDFLSKPSNKSFNKLGKKLTSSQEQLLDAIRNRESLVSKLRGINDKLKQPGISKDEEQKLLNGKKILKNKLNSNKKLIQERKVELDQLRQKSEKVKAFQGRITKASTYLGGFTTAVQVAKESLLKVANASTKVSNKFVSQSSVFVDSDIRNLMGRFGVDTKTAQGLSSASEALNIDLSDYSKLTSGQRKAFSELMNHYQAGINSIDTEKLDKFNESTQRYQLMRAKFDMDMQLNMNKLLANSPAVSRIMDTLNDGMEGISNLLGSPAVQKGFNLIMDLLNGILKFVTTPLNWLGKALGGNSSTVNNTKTATVSNVYNVNGGLNTEQLAIDIGLQLQSALD